MLPWLSRLLDRLSNHLAARKGLLPIIGILLILANYILQFMPVGWLKETNLLLHVGLVLSIFGLMLAWAL